MLFQKSISILLIISFLLALLCSCNNTDTPSIDTTSLNNNENASNENETLFLIMMGEGVLASNSAGFKNAGNYGVGMSSQETQLEDVKQKISNPLDPSKKMTYSHSYCTPKNSFSDEPGTFYSIYDWYGSGDENFVYLHGTDLLCFYSNGYSPSRVVEYPKLSEDDIKEISDKFLSSVIDEKYLRNIPFEGHCGTDVVGRYVMVYTRKIHGYDTDESISAYINVDGTFDAFNGYNIGKYDSLISNITKEQIDSAKETLIAKLEAMDRKNMEIRGPMLTTNTEGRVFLELRYTYTTDSGLETGEIAYVNVN